MGSPAAWGWSTRRLYSSTLKDASHPPRKTTLVIDINRLGPRDPVIESMATAEPSEVGFSHGDRGAVNASCCKELRQVVRSVLGRPQY